MEEIKKENIKRVIKREYIQKDNLYKIIASAILAATFMFPAFGCKAKEENKETIIGDITIEENNEKVTSSMVEIKDLGTVSLLTSNDGSYIYGPVKKVYDVTKDEEYYVIYGNNIKGIEKSEYGVYSTYSYGSHGFNSEDFVIGKSLSLEEYNSPAISMNSHYKSLDENTAIKFELENSTFSLEKFKSNEDDFIEYTWKPIGFIEKEGVTTVYFAYINDDYIEGVELGSLYTRTNPYYSYSFSTKGTTINEPVYQK